MHWFLELLKEGVEAHLLVHVRSKPGTRSIAERVCFPHSLRSGCPASKDFAGISTRPSQPTSGGFTSEWLVHTDHAVHAAQARPDA